MAFWHLEVAGLLFADVEGCWEEAVTCWQKETLTLGNWTMPKDLHGVQTLGMGAVLPLLLIEIDYCCLHTRGG